MENRTTNNKRKYNKTGIIRIKKKKTQMKKKQRSKITVIVILNRKTDELKKK